MPVQLNVCMLGSKFMGRMHSNAWLTVHRFFDPGIVPVMHTVVARNQPELEAFAARWGWQQATTDWHAAVTDDEIDLVDIGTPNNVHAAQAIAALEAGKHVACEKPLAGTLEDAEAMAAAAARSNGRTFVWFNYRHVPAVALAHELVASGALGRIYHVRAAYLQSWGGPDTPLLWRFQDDVAGSGAHGDLNAHIIDAVRFVTGEDIVTVEGAIEHTFIEERRLVGDPPAGEVATSGTAAATGRSTVDDAVLFLARLSGGGVASFEASRLATGYQNANRFEIHGERGALRFDFERMNELGYYDLDADPAVHGWTTIDVTQDGHPYREAWAESDRLGYPQTFVDQAADLLTVLAGGEPRVPMPDFADALQTQRVLHAAIVSARTRAPVSVSDLDTAAT